MNALYYEKEVSHWLERYNEIYWHQFDKGYRGRDLRIRVAKIYKGRL
jgi:hypothetical protein